MIFQEKAIHGLEKYSATQAGNTVPEGSEARKEYYRD